MTTGETQPMSEKKELEEAAANYYGLIDDEEKAHGWSHTISAFKAGAEHQKSIMNQRDKPDGYVAWKPAGALDNGSYDIVRGDWDYGGHKGETVGGSKYEYIELFATPYQVEKHSDPFRLGKQNEGWKIRPVRLTFLDEPKEQEK